MNYIVLDLEWNQAADLKTKLENDLIFEIIEIGAVKLDENKKQTDMFHALIKPQVFHTMNYETGELVHLSMNELETGRSFVEVAQDFISWCGDEYVFCTWGMMDLVELQKNMDYYGMPSISKAPIKFYDVQKLFSIAYEDKKVRRTLEFAVDYLKIEKDITFHRADADAYYTAKVFGYIEDKSVLIHYSYDTYRIPESRKHEIHAVFDDYGKYISKAFSDRLQAMEDEEVNSSRCMLCGAATDKRVNWFTNNRKHYYAAFYCKEHGWLKGKVRIKRTSDNRIYVVKTMKQIDEKELDEIIKKRKQGRESRKEKRKR